MKIKVLRKNNQMDFYDLFVVVLPSGNFGCLYKKNYSKKAKQPPNIYWGYKETLKFLVGKDKLIKKTL